MTPADPSPVPVQEGQPVTEPTYLQCPCLVAEQVDPGCPHHGLEFWARVNPTPVPVPTDDLRKQVNELGELAQALFEAQFARSDGGRMPADPTWDDLEPSERDEFWEQARNAWHVFGPIRAELTTAREKLTEFVAASLETDYTVDADLSDGYDTDADEQDAAVANIVEMHRVLLVREELLFTAYEEVDNLRAAQLGAVAEAARQLRAQQITPHKPNESEYDFGYREAYTRICDWLEHEFKPAPVSSPAPEGQTR